MEINDEHIYKRIQLYRKQEVRISKAIKLLDKAENDIAELLYNSEHTIVVSDSIFSSVSLLKKERKDIRDKCEELKGWLSRSFWEGKVYDEV